MFDLSNLSPKRGAVKERKRLGRGPGSGTGKTCGKGHKGQKSRSGGGKGPWFEGGQMPIYRRLRKRGFKNPFRVAYQVVNLDMLSSRFKDGDRVDAQSLKEKRLIRKLHEPIKVLARGEIDKALTLSVEAVSEKAREAIEKAGGKIIVTEAPKPLEQPSEVTTEVEKPKAETIEGDSEDDTKEKTPKETSLETSEEEEKSPDPPSDEIPDETPKP